MSFPRPVPITKVRSRKKIAREKTARRNSSFRSNIIGSMIDGPSRSYHRYNAGKTSKATGVQINYRRDQAFQGELEIVKVAMPRMHPLFYLESDDPCDIPSMFGLELVARAYDGSCGDSGDSYSPPDDDLSNPLAVSARTLRQFVDGESVRCEDELTIASIV
ncbi:hypothetical protein QQZ08_004360 [Neonectria magnoliae]|uniref:Uncharacterized protein n=1 Tax=Neonectria magnoliae TaxID=2732573 RepID=A0ABR1I6P9_9HYPO